ncbi:SurA N-terminal domain-containing protein [Sediminibacillus albus]|uniref:SurA N-terminal domain-containing protein n=1 Tax=Sediminibacillus albus TaxID=407036 RepID=A0A1G8YJ32_9BACI|nr:SurA N-terminal domain-containing protein [Sediminibacillus albus]SDK02713.1 SurA N-terminal domain-containing protein [Sediminibacillus albus]
MKKITLLIMMVLISILAACSDDKENAEGSNKEANQNQEANQEAQEELAKQQKEQQKQLEEQQVDEGEVVAVVNGEEIKGKEYNKVLPQTIYSLQQSGQKTDDKELVKKKTVDMLVNQKLVMQEIAKQEIEAPEEKVDQSFEQYKSQFESEEKFQTSLEKNGDTEESIRKSLAKEVKMQMYLQNEIPETKVSDEEVQQYYDELSSQRDDLPKFEEAKDKIKDILVQQKQNEEITKLLAQLKEESEVETRI